MLGAITWIRPTAGHQAPKYYGSSDQCAWLIILLFIEQANGKHMVVAGRAFTLKIQSSSGTLFAQLRNNYSVKLGHQEWFAGRENYFCFVVEY